MNLSEAFKRLELLDEDVFNLTKDGLEDLKDFEEDSDDEEEVIDVMDPDAESEEDLADSYIGKVILDCEVCHTDIYKDKEDITIDEETQLANVGEECPYCFSNEGFKIIGEVKPFVETTFETEDDVDVEVDGEEVEEDEEKNESLRGYKKIAESISKKDKRFLNEAARLNFKKFGIDRLPEEDFSDDGTRFRMFVCDGMPISFARYAGKAYLAIRPDYLSELSYKEYSKLPTYRDCNKYNGVPEEDVDLSDVAEICKKLKAEYDEAVDRKLNNTSKNESLKRNRRLKESCSINQCQKWVDYDMKKYKKISDDTMEKIKSSGYSVVKDQYGDYEVIADRKDESCGDRKPRKMKESILSEARIKKSWKKIDTVDAEVLDRTRVVAPNAKKYGFYNGEIDFEGTRLPKRGTGLKVDIYDTSDDPEWRQYGDEPYYAVINKTKPVKESIEDITIDTGDQEITVSAKDKEKIESDGEMIAPVSDETKDEIEMDSENVESDDSTEDADIDEFSEEEFDKLGESYLKKVYENVNNYKTTSAKIKGNKLYLEGLIKFNSGKTKKTLFIFESKTLDKNNRAKFIGENVQISRGHKSFKLTGTLNNNKFIAESLNYNYKAKDGSGNSKRIYGTVKVK